MSVLPVGFGSSGGIDTGDIGHSLRCRSAASAYLSKTITTDATSTYFAAVKRGKLGVVSPIFDTNIKFNANDTLTAFGLTTTAVFRDPTSWLFIHVSNGGLYINGVSFGAVTTSALTNPRIGFDGTNYFDGYIARIGCVAGSSSAYTNFGYLNTEINEWVSKSQSAVKVIVDAGGTNSFMLDFDDATSLTTLGYDKSSKGNNWTLNNFSLTAGTTYDHMLDVPGNSYPVINTLLPVNSTAPTVSEANLKWSRGSTAPGWTAATLPLPQSGKWYWETDHTSSFSGAPLWTGVVTSGRGAADDNDNNIAGVQADSTWWWGRQSNGSSVSSYLSPGGLNAVVAHAYDGDTGKYWCGYVSGGAITWGTNGGVGDPAAGTNALETLSGVVTPAFGQFLTAGATRTITEYFNAGQRPFSASSVPTGFLALCQANEPDVPTELLNPTDHHIDITVTKSGDTNFTLPWDASVYDTFFEIKRRDAAGDWYQIDGLRGYTKILKSNSTAAETTDANVLGVSGTTCTLKSTLPNGTYIVSATKAGLVSARSWNFDGALSRTATMTIASPCVASIATHGFSDGQAVQFTTTGALPTGVTASTTYYARSTGTGTFTLHPTEADAIANTNVINTSGSQSGTHTCEHASRVSRNVDSGFSIVTYTGTGANATVGHGLGVVTKMLLAKDRSTVTQWPLWHISLTSGAYSLYLNLTDAQASYPTIWNSTAPTSTVFSVGTATGVNNSGSTYVAYCYADSAIQKSFSYTGNGSADGPNPYLGFECGRSLIKRTDLADHWRVVDSARKTYNVQGAEELYLNSSVGEGSGTDFVDLIALGLKLRNNLPGSNASGGTYIGHAWAATTGKYSLGR